MGHVVQHLPRVCDFPQSMIKSLGKKEGELAGFREQLQQANLALKRSEEALEVRAGCPVSVSCSPGICCCGCRCFRSLLYRLSLIHI